MGTGNPGAITTGTTATGDTSTPISIWAAAGAAVANKVQPVSTAVLRHAAQRCDARVRLLKSSSPVWPNIKSCVKTHKLEFFAAPLLVIFGA